MPELRARFLTTSWSVVLRSRGCDEVGRAAIAQLCEEYWSPLYGFARRLGRSPEDAADAVQGFVSDLLTRDGFAVADPQRGRFRSFLCGAFRNWLRNDAERQRAYKRGGGVTTLSLTTLEPEGRFAREPADVVTPERAFDRSFVMTILELALRDVETTYDRKGRTLLFTSLRPVLTGVEVDYGSLATALDSTDGALRVSAYRLRREYRVALVSRIRQTVEAENDVEDEVRALFAALSR